jgi:hypothetical protein
MSSISGRWMVQFQGMVDFVRQQIVSLFLKNIYYQKCTTDMGQRFGFA